MLPFGCAARAGGLKKRRPCSVSRFVRQESVSEMWKAMKENAMGEWRTWWRKTTRARKGKGTDRFATQESVRCARCILGPSFFFLCSFVDTNRSSIVEGSPFHHHILNYRMTFCSFCLNPCVSVKGERDTLETFRSHSTNSFLPATCTLSQDIARVNRIVNKIKTIHIEKTEKKTLKLYNNFFPRWFHIFLEYYLRDSGVKRVGRPINLITLGFFLW